MSTGPTAEAPDRDPDRDRAYVRHRDQIRARVDRASGPLFSTDATDLYATYLAALPAAWQQRFACATCRRFVDTYGGLVQLDEAGRAQPLLWDSAEAPEPYRAAVSAVARAVTRAAITGVALRPEAAWGRAEAGGWTHLSGTPPEGLRFKAGPLRTAAAEEAARREDFATLSRGLAAFPLPLVEQAAALLSSGQLYRSEASIGVATWLVALHRARAAARGAAERENLVWRAAATAPPGFAHVRSTMIGTLLEDLLEKRPFEEVKARFDAKMHPLQYQRPQAPPTAGNIADAERIVAKLGLEPALERRFARLDDVQALWTPRAAPPAERGGVFSHLQPKARPAPEPMDLPATKITWEKFARTVLPNAEHIALLIPSANASYATLVTAADPEAPPILQWDHAARRNPVSWYTYVKGSPPKQWNLTAGAWVEVTAVTLSPPMWGDEPNRHAHHGKAVFLLLAGARDTGHTKSGGYFPSMLRSELHAVRATLEAHALQAAIAGLEEASAAGLMLSASSASWDAHVRVTTGSVRTAFVLERWD